MSLAGANFYRTAPDLNAAEQYAQAALKLVPYWHYVRDILMVKIREAQAKQTKEIRTTRRVLREQGLPALWRQHSQQGACHRSPDDYGIPFNRAAYSALLGETDQAMQWLGRAYDQHDNRLLTLKVDPQFDRLRSDPQFVNLMKKIGLTI
jgi:hypothetical protein